MDKFMCGWIVGVVVMLISTTIFDEHTASYRQGQIDALSGEKVQFELKRQPDGTVVWVRK